MSINTVRKYLNSKSTRPRYYRHVAVEGKLTPHKSYLTKRVTEAAPTWLPATALLREIKAHGYRGEIGMLRAFLRTLKPSVEAEPILRYETLPGEQMQVDWAEFRKRRTHRLAAFVATLGYSRASYVEFVKDEKIDTLLSCHIHAFQYFGGIPKNCLYDNMKTVVISRDAYGRGIHRYHSKLWEFAKHYGFIPKLCRPYRAKTKGKVERFIHYLRHSFYNPLQSQLHGSGLMLDKTTANVEVLKWLNEVANQRIHGTTQAVPFQRLAQERTHLLALPTDYPGQISQTNPLFMMPMLTSVAPASETKMMIQNTQLQHSLSRYDEFTQGENK